uniref:Uncharacterized protein n=2 Tax=Oryza sativa subsp. japonica TaxID=39947 RepID=Q2R759_ORYSJ|nr:hypothetical protein [Oryza sativa Japonica Group]ABA92636.1 hypothetical protein LOC_Os11g17710 [Oryza sativa Japonica Group]
MALVDGTRHAKLVGLPPVGIYEHHRYRKRTDNTDVALQLGVFQGIGQPAAPRCRSTVYLDMEDFNVFEGCHHLYTHLKPTVGYEATTRN